MAFRDMDDMTPYVMNELETVLGSVFGYVDDVPSVSTRTTPRAAIEATVRRALMRPPCGVAFSGGRDSSVVLAVAAHVARRDGLPPPIPITRVFPAVPAAGETAWQEDVVRHLRLRDWERKTFTDELDVVGPLAQRHLLESGVVWPPTIHVDVPMLEACRGGTLIDGEGGDEVLGVEAHRVAPIAALAQRRWRARRRDVRAAARAVAPRFVRTRAAAAQFAHRSEWLRPAMKQALIAAVIEDERHQPLSFGASVRLVLRRRTQVELDRTRSFQAGRMDVHTISPLVDVDFVDAVARRGRVLGNGSRTSVLRSLVPDLLPDEILSRTTKADFTRAYMGAYTTAFAERWGGEGVDPDLVDPIALRSAWLQDPPRATTAALLQQAWLATEGSGARHLDRP